MSRIALRLVVAVALAAAPAFAADTTTPPKLGPETRDYDQENLDLDLDLDFEKGSLTGTARHTMTALADISNLRLHLTDMTVTSIAFQGSTKCTWTRADDVLTIALDPPRKKGERFTF